MVFAIESTLSQGDRWDWTQAEQAAWLFDEKLGWVKLKDRYGRPFEDNFGRRIGGGFEAEMGQGFQPRMTVHSDANRILLAMRADRVALQARDRSGQIMIAGGDATFTWKERRIVGKVYMRNVRHEGQGAGNIFFQNTKGMHRESLYFAVGKQGFMSLVRTNEKSYAPLGGELSMTLLLDTLSSLATDVSMEATGYKRLGLYEFPTEWQGTFSVDGRSGMFKLVTFDTQTTEFLLFAGTRIASARGFMNFDGESYPIFGMAEVEGRLQGKRKSKRLNGAPKPKEDITPGSSWEAIAH